jgi:transposase
MLSVPHGVRIFVALDAVDMRKSFDGLAALTCERLGVDPLSGHLVVFRNRRGNMLKVLFFDRSGYTIVFRRLEAGTFQLPQGRTRAEIDPGELAMILEGIDLRSIVRRARYSRIAERPVENGISPISLGGGV